MRSRGSSLLMTQAGLQASDLLECLLSSSRSDEQSDKPGLTDNRRVSTPALVPRVVIVASSGD